MFSTNMFKAFKATGWNFVRHQGGITEKEVETAKKWLESVTFEKIPRQVFDITFSRSSGPGGQKVNKTSSKATVAMEPYKWLNPQFCYWIPKAVIQQIKEKNIRYHTKSGGLLVQSDLTRNREDNVDECFKKILNEIKTNTYFQAETLEEDKQKWEEIGKVAKEKRMFHKKKQSDKKKMRSKKIDF